MTKQNKIIVAVLCVVFISMALVGYKEYSANEKNRLMEIEADYVSQMLLNDTAVFDVVNVGTLFIIKPPSSKSIHIKLKQGMDHSRTKSFFPNNKWKGWQVTYSEAYK